MRLRHLASSFLPSVAACVGLLSGCSRPYEHAHVEVRRERVVVEPASPPPVPGRVLETAEREGNGRRVESARLVRRDGRDLYLVHMAAPGKDDITLRIEPDGDLRGIER